MELEVVVGEVEGRKDGVKRGEEDEGEIEGEIEGEAGDDENLGERRDGDEEAGIEMMLERGSEEDDDDEEEDCAAAAALNLVAWRMSEPEGDGRTKRGDGEWRGGW